MAVGRDWKPLDSQHSLRSYKFLCLAPIGGDDPQGPLPIGRASDDGESPAIREPTPTKRTNVAAGQLKTLETLSIQVENPKVGESQSVAVIGNASSVRRDIWLAVEHLAPAQHLF